MRKPLSVLAYLVVALAMAPAQAESATGTATGSQSDQLFQCQQKVRQLSEQARPLQTKLAGLRVERKGVSSSGGEVARFKLSNLDQEIAQVLKQLDGVNGQIDSENKRCDEITHKPATPPAQATPAPKPSPSNKRKH